MRPTFLTGIMATLFLFWPTSAASQMPSKFDLLFEDFDIRPFSVDEIRLLQSALAVQGYSDRPIDGRWGVASQQGLENYASSSDPENIVIVTLVSDFLAQVEKRGWRYKYLSDVDLSIALPMNEVSTSNSDEGITWKHVRGGLTIKFFQHSFDQLGDIHQAVVTDTELVTKRSELHTHDRWISKATHLTGEVYYARSRHVADKWFSLTAIATRDEAKLLNAIVTSIVEGKAADWSPPDHGYLSEIMSLAHRFEIEQDKDFQKRKVETAK